MERVEREQFDLLFIVLLILILGLGLVFFFSASYYHSEKIGRNPLHLFNKQVLFVALGSLVLILFSRFSPEKLKRFIPLLMGFSLFLLILPLLPGIGKEINGARRWISFFGYTFQPSEIAKFTIIVYLAYILQKKEDRLNQPLVTLIPPLLIVFIFAIIIFFQNDLSASLFLIMLALIMFFIAKVPFYYFLFFGSVFFPLAALLLLTKNYWIEKIIIYFDPARDPYHYGFQIRHSRLAFELGGFWGRGLGMGSQKLGYLPEADSDYIFASIAEEIGFVGVFLIILLFCFFALRAYAIAFKSKDCFSYYLGFGLTSMIFLQALINMLVTVGLVPATGMPLPFFSLGGSAMIVNMAACGVIISLSRNSKINREFWNG